MKQTKYETPTMTVIMLQAGMVLAGSEGIPGQETDSGDGAAKDCLGFDEDDITAE